jgi:hypothetical protein
VVEDFDAVNVCCACVEPEVCNCVVPGFIFVVFPCGFDVLPLCLVGWVDGFLGEFTLCFLFYKSLDCFKVRGCVFVLKCFEVWVICYFVCFRTVEEVSS